MNKTRKIDNPYTKVNKDLQIHNSHWSSLFKDFLIIETHELQVKIKIFHMKMIKINEKN